jgi:hypothetical protein
VSVRRFYGIGIRKPSYTYGGFAEAYDGIPGEIRQGELSF